MQKMATDVWWVLLLQGLLAVVFGVIAITNIGATALVLFIWFAILALADGIFHIFLSFRQRQETPRWWFGLLRGLASILVGILVFVWPKLTALILLYFIAARAIVEGFFAVSFAIQWRKALRGEWLTILGGTLAILFGLWMFFHPLIGGLAILWVIGLYAVVIGIMRIIQAFKAKFASDTSPPAAA